MGLLQNLYEKVSNSIKSASNKNQDIYEYLKEKIQLKSEETVNDQNRLYRFRNYVLEMEDELEKVSRFKIEYYNATILGVDAIAFIDIDDYQENQEKAMPLYIVSPLFVYAPDVDKMIYMREGDTDDISELLNYQADWKLNANTNSRSSKNDSDLENLRTSINDFKEIILPMIQKTMVDDSEQDKKMARESILQTESDRVKKYVEKAINLEDAEHELNLKQLQYQEDSLDFERKVERYNTNVKAFQKKLDELKDGIAYLKERENELIQLSNTVNDLENTKSILPQEKLEEIQEMIEGIIKQYQQDSISAITNIMKDMSTPVDKEEITNQLNETIDNIIETYKTKVFETNDIQDKEPLEMTMNYLEVNKEDLITPVVEEATKIANKPFKLESYHNVAIMNSIRNVQDAYKSVNGIQESDVECLKKLCSFLKQLNMTESISIVKNYSNEGCLIFRKETNNQTNLYVLSPVLFGNVTTQEYYAGFDVENNLNTSEEIQIKDEQFFGKIISYITAYYLNRTNSKEIKLKEISEPKESNWTNKMLNAKAYLQLNAHMHKKIEQLGVQIGFGTGKVQVSDKEIYNGSAIGYLGLYGFLYILPTKIVLVDRENNYQSVPYETNIQLASILSSNNKYAKFLVDNPKLNLSDKKLIQLLFTPLISGLDLRGNYVKRLQEKQNEKERV